MSDMDKLRAAGWEVVDNSDHILMRATGSAADTAYARVNKNADGSLHLVKERSAFHRTLAAILASEPPSEADYTPRNYGS